jgi:hypothetical protein
MVSAADPLRPKGREMALQNRMSLRPVLQGLTLNLALSVYRYVFFPPILRTL